MSLKELPSISSAELKSFLDSFDNVLCDCDGVVWTINTPISGVKEALSKLRECGKHVGFVSNNCTHGLERFQQKFNTMQLGAEINDITYPTLAIIDYLKTVNFNKAIFLLGSSMMKKELIDAGFTIANNPDNTIQGLEDLQKLLQNNEDVGAVVVDADLNLNYPKLLQASTYLRRPEVLFIIGATEKIVHATLDIEFMGPGYFQYALADYTNRVPLGFGKPGLNFKKYITKKFNIQDPSRTLFIGDSLEQDMQFASNCGYQKLLVLTGATSLDQVTKCTEKDMIPDFYINSLGELHELIKDKLSI